MKAISILGSIVLGIALLFLGTAWMLTFTVSLVPSFIANLPTIVGIVVLLFVVCLIHAIVLTTVKVKGEHDD